MLLRSIAPNPERSITQLSLANHTYAIDFNMSTIMPPPPPGGRIALLIGGDDLCPSDIDALMANLATYGPRVNVRRIYGKWTQESLTKWGSCLARHALQAMSDQKWSTWDGSMIIDAMDMLHSDRFSHFCIVSPYSNEYARLVSRIREQGAMVYGYGFGLGAFAAACDSFQILHELDGYGDNRKVHVTPSTPTSTPVTLAPATTMPTHTHVALSQPIQIDQTARDALTLGIVKTAQPDGQALLDDVAEYIWKFHGCCHCMYGYFDSLQFIRATGIAYSKRLITNGHLPPITFISLKTGAGTTMSGSEGLVYRMEEMVVVPTELGHARAHDVAAQQDCIADYEVITTI
ncbi:hypothetical protein LTR56_003034 [Elasticomyces elasticus]|nr:hypothetical protein LTR56_003034 [Elasticomyces elasticus]KAK3662097.1 hypothetical protein LTR22_007069 [Elasticomyces elasticus]KAK4927540.1 hypothetical protein LTR49_005681 [Elasticomyces elasticus]KAK5753247.1 hypothetical protein LTS12_016714 [Elasticomyces elasticus]